MPKFLSAAARIEDVSGALSLEDVIDQARIGPQPGRRRAATCRIQPHESWILIVPTPRELVHGTEVAVISGVRKVKNVLGVNSTVVEDMAVHHAGAKCPTN